MASSELKEALTGLVKSAADEFFTTTEPIADYRYAAAGSTDASVAVTYASVIGYSGDTIKGSLVVTCEKELLDKSHPNHAMGMPVGDPEIIDWIGEIANQMLGRIKNKLSSAGVKFAMGTPTTVTGKSMQITPPKDGFTLSLVYKGGEEGLSDLSPDRDRSVRESESGRQCARQHSIRGRLNTFLSPWVHRGVEQ